MITRNLRSQTNRLRDVFWSGGIANPLEVVDPTAYLLFIKRLDDLHPVQEKNATGQVLIRLCALLTVQKASV